MKRKIVSICLVVCLIAIAAVGTLAYFNDSDQATNTFTIGNVDIVLDEAKVKAEGDLYVIDETADRVHANEYKDIYPGAVIPKDPTVRNVGTYDAYVKVDITVSNNALKAFRADSVPFDAFKSIVTGGIMGNDYSDSTDNGIKDGLSDGNYLLTYKIGAENTVFTVYALNVFETGSSLTVFDTLTVPTALDTPDFYETGLHSNGFRIDIVASAIQAKGFSNAADAFNALENQLSD